MKMQNIYVVSNKNTMYKHSPPVNYALEPNK